MDGELFPGVPLYRLALPGDPLGVSCDEDGPSVGPVRLLKRGARGVEPRSTRELEFVLGQAFGYPIDMTARMSGLSVAATSLNDGDLLGAMTATQSMRLPELADQGAFCRAIQADTLAKSGFDPDEPRDNRGR